MLRKIPKVYFVLAFMACIKLLLHLFTAGNYGYFNDELYAIAMSKHLAFGYVDLPPIVPALLALSRHILGESVFAVHILPAIVGSITVVFVGLITKELGGKIYAVTLTCLAYIITPTWLAFNSFFGYDGFDQLFLAVFILILIKFLKSNDKKLWIVLGLFGAICVLTKATILFYGVGLLLSLFIFGYRKHFATWWPYLGFILFLIIISPYLIWQGLNNFPTLDYWASYIDHGTYHASLIEYLKTMLIIMNPFSLPLWIVGIYSIIRAKKQESKLKRFFGITWIVSLVLIYVLNGKSTMLVALFIPLFSFGAIFVEENLSKFRKVKIAIVAYLVIAGIILAPLSVPILPPETLVSVLGGMSRSIQLDNNVQGQLPEHFASRFGWENMASTVAKAYKSLSYEDQKNCGIFANDYDQAAAIDMFGPKYGLNKSAMSGRLTYHLWGYGNFNGDVMISIGMEPEYLKDVFNDITPVDVIRSKYAMPGDTNLLVYVCRGLKINVKDFWRDVKNY